MLFKKFIIGEMSWDSKESKVLHIYLHIYTPILVCTIYIFMNFNIPSEHNYVKPKGKKG